MREAVLNISISGMSSPSCVSRIERVLDRETNIKKTSINLATEEAHVIYNADKISSIDIINSIFQAGFEIKGHARRKFLKINLALAVLLTFPLMLSLLFGFRLNPWFQLLLCTPIQFFCGRRFYIISLKGLKKLKLNFELLVILSTSSAYFLSLYFLINQEILEQGTYFDSAAIVMAIALIASYLESKSRKHSTETLRSLESLLPLDAASHKMNEIVTIKPRSRIPVDGVVIEGFSQTYESQITGESFAIFKGVGDQVIGGSKNGDGFLKVKVTAVGEQTVLARTIRLVEDTQIRKATVQKTLDQFTSLIVFFILLASILTLFTKYQESLDWEEAFIRAVTLLIVTAPSVLMMAIPMAIILGERLASKNGVLIKDAGTLEKMQETTLVAFDKSGILTEGKPFVTRVLSLSITERDFIKIISSLQSESNHPLAKAILDYAENKQVPFTKVQMSLPFSGQGVEGEVEGKSYGLVGPRLMELPLSAEAANFLENCRAEGDSVSFLINKTKNVLVGIIAFQDNIKVQSPMAITQLKAMGIKTAVLSGDNQSSAQNLANTLGIDIVHSDLFPDEKTELINSYKKKNVLAIAGDGTDDALTLAMADVGITLSTGSEAAIHNAGITLMRGNPQLISDAISISKSTYSKIRQNLFWALAFSVAGLPFAVWGNLSPSMAGRLIVLSSFCVLFNSLMLKRWKSLPRYR